MARGLVPLVTSEAYRGLKEAIATVFTGASWQRCRTDFTTNLLSRMPEAGTAGGSDDGADYLPAAFRRLRCRALHRHLVEKLEESIPSGAFGRGWPGHPGLNDLPGRPLGARG